MRSIVLAVATGSIQIGALSASGACTALFPVKVLPGSAIRQLTKRGYDQTVAELLNRLIAENSLDVETASEIIANSTNPRFELEDYIHGNELISRADLIKLYDAFESLYVVSPLGSAEIFKPIKPTALHPLTIQEHRSIEERPGVQGIAVRYGTEAVASTNFSFEDYRHLIVQDIQVNLRAKNQHLESAMITELLRRHPMVEQISLRISRHELTRSGREPSAERENLAKYRKFAAEVASDLGLIEPRSFRYNDRDSREFEGYQFTFRRPKEN